MHSICHILEYFNTWYAVYMVSLLKNLEKLVDIFWGNTRNNNLPFTFTFFIN